MSVKRLRSESVVRPVPRGLRDMVKARLPELQSQVVLGAPADRTLVTRQPLIALVGSRDQGNSDEWAMADEVSSRDERSTYSRARTSYVNGTRDCLRGETPRATEPS